MTQNSNNKTDELFKLIIEINNKTGDIQRDIGILTTKLDDFSSRLRRVEDREDGIEKDVIKLKNNWGWLVAIASAAGGLVGYIVQIILHLLSKT